MYKCFVYRGMAHLQSAWHCPNCFGLQARAVTCCLRTLHVWGLPAEQAVLRQYVMPAGRPRMLGVLGCYCLVPKGADSHGGQAYLDAGHAEKLLHGA